MRPDASLQYRFYDPSQPVAYLSGNLPHWRQAGVTYFVTFRLADSIPQVRLRQWRQERAVWLRTHPEPHSQEQLAEFWERFSERFHRWLDANHGDCLLSDDAARTCMESVLRHFDGDRYQLGKHVVMPNHVHAVVVAAGDGDLSRVLHSWKSFSAKQINRIHNRSGVVWQQESFDHIVRSALQLERINAYIRENPRTRPADR